MGRSIRYLYWAGGIAVLALAAAGAWRFAASDRSRPLPALNLAQAPPAARQAIEAARTQVAAQPRSGAAWGQLGLLLRAHEFGAEANACLEEAARLDPQEFLWPYIHGVSLAITAPAQARICFQRAAVLRGRSVFPVLRLGELALQEQQADEAARLFRTALDLQPDNPRAQLGMARWALLQGDFPASLKWAQASAATAPHQRVTHELLARIQARLGAESEARRELQILEQSPDLEREWEDPFVARVLQLRRDPAWVAGAAQELLAQGRTAEALQKLEELVTAAPEDVPAAVLLARTLIGLQDYARAESVLTAALQRHPDEASLHFQRGVCRSRQRQWAAAAACFREAVRLKPDSGDAHFNLGHAYQQLADNDSALAAFREAIRFQPDLAIAHARLGELLQVAGDRAAALEHLQLATELNPADVRSRQLLSE